MPQIEFRLIQALAYQCRIASDGAPVS